MYSIGVLLKILLSLLFKENKKGQYMTNTF